MKQHHKIFKLLMFVLIELTLSSITAQAEDPHWYFNNSSWSYHDTQIEACNHGSQTFSTPTGSVLFHGAKLGLPSTVRSCLTSFDYEIGHVLRYWPPITCESGYTYNTSTNRCETCSAPFQWQSNGTCTFSCSGTWNASSRTCEHDFEQSTDTQQCGGAGGPAAVAGNPIDFKSGDKIEIETDFQAPSPSILVFQRFYSSHNNLQPRGITAGTDPEISQALGCSAAIANGAAGALQSVKLTEAVVVAPAKPSYGNIAYSPTLSRYGSAGKRNWRNTFERNLVFNTSEPNTIKLQRHNGSVITLHFSGNGTYTSSQGYDGTLTLLASSDPIPNGWEYQSPQGDKERYDADGKLIELLNPQQLGVYLTYDPISDHLKSARDDFGHTLSFIYGNGETVAPSLIQAMTVPGNRQYTYTYTPQGQVESVTYPFNPATETPRTRTYLYGDSCFTSALTGITDENGARFATFDYDNNGRAKLSEHADQADRITIAYNDAANTRTVTNAVGKETVYHFNSHHQIDSVEGEQATNCAAANAAYFYDANQLLERTLDWEGTETTFDYDSTSGLELSRTEANGTPEARTIATPIWDTRLRLPKEIIIKNSANTGVKKTNMTYTSNGRLDTLTETDLTGMADVSSRLWDYAYTYHDAAQKQLATLRVDGPRNTTPNDLTTLNFNTAGLLTSSSNALGHTVTITQHSVDGLPQTWKDANGVSYSATYTTSGWLKTLAVDGGTTTFGYDNVGQVTQITFPDTTVLHYDYDDAHRLISIYNDDGDRISYGLDTFGNIEEENRQQGNQTLFQQKRLFDALGRLYQVFDLDSSVLSEIHYDTNSNANELVDANLNSIYRSFDGLNRLKTISDQRQATTATTALSSNTLDQLTNVNDPKQQNTSYVYDGYGLLQSQTSPDTGTTTFNYDAAGNLSQKTDARAVTTKFSYDALNRLTKIDYPSNVAGVINSTDVEFTYDQGTNGKGNLTNINQGAGNSIVWGYDKRGNITSDTRNIGGKSFTTKYHYDKANNLLDITYPSSKKVVYARDAFGNITGVTHDGNNVASNITHQPFGPTNGYLLGNGLNVDFTYDGFYRLNAIQVGSIMDWTLHYDDPRGLIGPITDNLSTKHDQTLTYDEIGRLETATTNIGNATFTYDLIGNRKTQSYSGTQPSHNDSYTYAASSHRLQSVSSNLPSEAHSYGYSATGNQATRDALSLKYDSSDRLVQIQNAPQAISYQHNPLGQRQQKTVNGVITYFVYDLNGQLIAELNSASNEFTDYLYLEGKPLAMAKPTPAAPVEPVQGATLPWPASILFVFGGMLLTILRKPLPMIRRYTKALRRTAVVMLLSGLGLSCQQAPVVNIPYDLFYFHTDHLGTVKLVTDKTAAVVWEGVYSPFGEAKEVVSEIENNLRFAGQYLDRESGLHYNYFRTYDPETGRYIESDPIGLKGGLNTYSYVENNPVMKIDPRGLLTGQIGLSGSINIGGPVGVSITAGIGVAIDDNGEVAIYYHGGGGAYTGSPGISGGVQGTVTNADTICDLKGPFDYGSASVDVGIGGSLDGVRGYDNDGNEIRGGGVTIGIGLGNLGYSIGETTTNLGPIGHIW